MVTQQVKKPGASITELAEEYGLSKATLYNMANRGELPGARRLGHRVIVHRETFERWLAEGNGAREDSEQ